MFNIFLIVQIILATFLIIVILLQRGNSDGLSGLGGSNKVMTTAAANSLLVRITVVFATLFIINSIILANLSGRKASSSNMLLEQINKESNQITIPIAK